MNDILHFCWVPFIFLSHFIKFYCLCLYFFILYSLVLCITFRLAISLVFFRCSMLCFYGVLLSLCNLLLCGNKAECEHVCTHAYIIGVCVCVFNIVFISILVYLCRIHFHLSYLYVIFLLICVCILYFARNNLSQLSEQTKCLHWN